MMDEIAVLKRRLEREKQARKHAETILEQKALELYNANQELRAFNEGLEQKVAERTNAQRISQTRLTALITNLNAGILVEDENHRIVLTNKTFCNLFEINTPPDQLVGANCQLAIEMAARFFENPQIFTQRIDEILQRQEKVVEEPWRFMDGRVLERDYVPILLDGQYLGHLWQYRDVTDVFYAQDALRRSEEKYRGIIENMELGLLEVDEEGHIVHPYPRFCEMVGYKPIELIGKLATDIFLPTDYLPIWEEQRHNRLAGKTAVFEMPMRTKRGEQMWALVSGAPIIELDGKISGSIGIHYDITPQKKLQWDLEEARQNAEQAQEAEKQFLANMSHEIRTPLNAIIGMAHLLYDTQPTEEQNDYLSILKNSAEMLRTLISDVLDLSKIRSGVLEAQEKEFDLIGLVQTMAKSFHLRMEGKPVKIESHIDFSLSTLMIGDDMLLSQILLNLLGNAEKFTEKGKISMHLSLEKQEGEVRWVKFVIADSGIGIPPEKQALIFQSFRQVDGDIKRRYGGTGLGLSITKQLVELQGGEISVESELGKGAAFTFVLAYRDSGKAIHKSETPTVSLSGIKVQGKKILVVEDNYMNRKYISTLLRKWDVEFSMANNGREGVEMAKISQYDLICMDIQMPEMDGYEASIAIRNSNNPNQQTKILALTASALLSQKDKAFAAGMDDYLSKPFKPTQLFEKIQSMLATDIQQGNHPEIEPAFAYHSRLDAKLLDELYGDDYDYARDMFDIFLKNTVPDFGILRKTLSAGNLKELGALAHRIKPTFGMVGLPDLEQQLDALEDLAKAGHDIAEVTAHFAAIEALFPAAIAAVERDLEKMTNLLEGIIQ